MIHSHVDKNNLRINSYTKDQHLKLVIKVNLLEVDVSCALISASLGINFDRVNGDKLGTLIYNSNASLTTIFLQSVLSNRLVYIIH